VIKLPAPLGKRYRRMVATLEEELSRDVHKARTALRQIVGNEIPVVWSRTSPASTWWRASGWIARRSSLRDVLRFLW